MECGSCHDVHNGPRVQDVDFVTGTLIGNGWRPYICSNATPSDRLYNYTREGAARPLFAYAKESSRQQVLESLGAARCRLRIAAAPAGDDALHFGGADSTDSPSYPMRCHR